MNPPSDSLPATLQAEIDVALRAMRLHPQHHLLVYYRYRLYEALKLTGDNSERTVYVPVGASQKDDLRAVARTFAARVRGWLGILTAEYVLPVFERASFRVEDIPDGNLDIPFRMLDLARSVVWGTVDPRSAFEIAGADEELAQMLNESRYDPEGFPLNGILAGLACQTAAVEATGWDSFKYLSENEKHYWLTPWRQEQPASAANGQTDLPEAEPNDEKWVYGLSDAAGRAAIAHSCGIGPKVQCDPARLEEFWTWWITEAWPKAWALARDMPKPG